MAKGRTEQLTAQLDWYWDAMLRPRLEGLSDDEYFWEPAPGCWTVRPIGEGKFQWDSEEPEPKPPPFTTIAWRMSHIGSLLAQRANYHFGDRSLKLDAVDWPGAASDAIGFMERGYDEWSTGVASLDDSALTERREGPPGTLDGGFPFAEVILHVNREVIHHGAEVALLRDLYRARGGRP